LIESDDRPASDWRITLALVWALAFGIAYTRMVIVERIPVVANWLRK